MRERVHLEVQDLHRFFVTWFRGRCDNTDEVFERDLTRRFAPDFALLQPSGVIVERGTLLGMIRHTWGTCPDLEIDIREVTAQAIGGETIVVTYQEWHRNAIDVWPVDAGRLSSAAMRVDPEQPGGLLWLHVHETWISESLPAPAARRR
jgi:hypothetical protein